MQRIVLDTNCLLMSLPRISPYRIIWDMFLESKFMLCVSTEIIEEYSEIVSNDRHFDILKQIDFPHVNVISAKEFSEHLTL